LLRAVFAQANTSTALGGNDHPQAVMSVIDLIPRVPRSAEDGRGWASSYGFTGKEEDVEVGLTYFGKRYLSAQLGRWVSADPLAVHAPGKADFNLYAYVSGSLLSDTDPLGLCGYNDSCENVATSTTNGEAVDAFGRTSTESNSQNATQNYEQTERLQQSFEKSGGRTASPATTASPTIGPGSDPATAKKPYAPNFEALMGPLGGIEFALTYAGSRLAGASEQDSIEAGTNAAADVAPVDGMLLGVAASRSQRADINASLRQAPQGTVPDRAQPSSAMADSKGRVIPAGPVANGAPGGAGRGGTKLRPDTAAEGPHSTFKRNADGKVTGHAEWTPNSRNPIRFDQAKRVDTQYASPHTDRGVPTPHTHGKNIPGGVRPATPDELPK
ncbi:MAG TPA: RHS repeat-associated core domain-containing protein, partial [Polyangiaceae bacterium]